MKAQEIDDLFEEFEAVMVRKFPPEEYGEDSDCDVLMYIAEQLRDAAKNEKSVLAEREKVKYIIKQMISDASSWTNEELYEIIDSL